MSLVFRQNLDLKSAVARSALIVLAKVERISDDEQFFHVRVTRTLLGKVAVDSDLEIRPAGWQQEQEAAAAMANAGLSISYSVPMLEGKAPVIKAGSSYVFLLGLNGELTAMNAWRPAKQADAVAALIGPSNPAGGPLEGLDDVQ